MAPWNRHQANPIKALKVLFFVEEYSVYRGNGGGDALRKIKMSECGKFEGSWNGYNLTDPSGNQLYGFWNIRRTKKQKKPEILFKGLNNENALATYTRIRATCVTGMEEHLKSQDSKTKHFQSLIYIWNAIQATRILLRRLSHKSTSNVWIVFIKFIFILFSIFIF